MFARRYAFICYCSLLLLLAVLLAEFVLLPRLFGMPRAMLLLGFTATPDTMIDGQRINALGFTGDALREKKPPDTVRVLVLGSSTMFNRHMGEQLKTALQKKIPNKHIELLDVGIRSHTTQADVEKLRYFANYQWDFVLFYNGINDLWANHVLPKDFYDDYRHLDPWYRRNFLLDNSLLARHLYNTGYTWLRVINQKIHFVLLPDYQFVFPKKPYINAANFASLPVFERNVNTILDLSTQLGAKPILLTFAFHLPANYSRQGFLNSTLGYHNPDHYDSRDVYNWGPPAYVREGLQQQNNALRNIATQRHVALLDMDAAMSGRGAWFGDVCHFNDDGVAVFAEQVAAAVGALATPTAAQSASAPSP